MTQLGFQLYSLHAIDDPLPAVLERIGETPFAGVEFAGLGDTAPDTLAATLADADLRAAGAHVDIEALETNVAETAETYRSLGCSELTVPYLDPAAFESATALDDTAGRLSDIATDLAADDIGLHYHNHDHEFVSVENQPALSGLAARLENVSLQVDLGWVGAAGHDPLAFFEEHEDQIELAHLKDYDGETGETVPLGEGDLDLDATMAAVEASDVEWLIYEAEERPDSYETLEYAVEVMEPYL
jgi:sugar phosphate isomerase/epimerase